MSKSVRGLNRNYIYDHLKGNKNEKVTVSLDLIIEEKGTSKILSFNGPPEALKESFEKIDINKLWEN